LKNREELVFDKKEVIIHIKYYLDDMLETIEENQQQMIDDYPDDPDYQDWDEINAYKFRVNLLHAENKETPKMVFGALFELLRNSAWDLWSALNSTISSIPELEKYIEDAEYESNEYFGGAIYFLSVYLDMDGEEVIKIMGDFDT
ncbi:MAG: hypothetical protein U9R12_05750, partial [Candidatus Caldatribacteriota bacterium]|nr:hypothetical protein [Candidatus Caldatribacteriota bacterium]